MLSTCTSVHLKAVPGRLLHTLRAKLRSMFLQRPEEKAIKQTTHAVKSDFNSPQKTKVPTFDLMR